MAKTIIVKSNAKGAITSFNNANNPAWQRQPLILVNAKRGHKMQSCAGTYNKRNPPPYCVAK